MSAAAPSAALSGPRVRFTPRAAILALAVVALLIYLIVPLRTYLDQRARLAQLERRTQILEQQNANLSKQVQRLNDPSYLERVARECLGMVRPGEIGFIVVPKTGVIPPANC